MSKAAIDPPTKSAVTSFVLLGASVAGVIAIIRPSLPTRLPALWVASAALNRPASTCLMFLGRPFAVGVFAWTAGPDPKAAPKRSMCGVIVGTVVTRL